MRHTNQHEEIPNEPQYLCVYCRSEPVDSGLQCWTGGNSEEPKGLPYPTGPLLDLLDLQDYLGLNAERGNLGNTPTGLARPTNW